MAKILPWSFSALDTFSSCPRQYFHKYVLKDVPKDTSPEIVWGNYVHKAFEDRQATNVELPADLQEHEKFMEHLDKLKDGIFYDTERKISLDINGKPVNEFFGDHIWWRGVIDWRCINEPEKRATLVDYKAGKPHDKWKQLGMFAIHTFLQFPTVDLVNAQFYWTKTATATKKVWSREDVPHLWSMFLPDLKQYAQAFKTDTWQERPSGLCNGWCPVTKCPHWRPKRVR